jgi:4-hydroxy-tetrahydrodipicolinate synthase
MEFSGVYTALITPFINDGVDQEGLRENCRFQIDSGVAGLVALGTTGETPTLSNQEQELVVQITEEACSGRVPMIVGTGTNSTKTTVERTQWAQNMGADAALVVTPYYNRPTQEGIYLHFKAVCENSDLPIMVYNIPGRTGQNIALSTLTRIAELPNVYGVKEAAGSIQQMHEQIMGISSCRPGFSVLSGDDELTIPLMAAGGRGVISVVSNLVPDKMVALVKAMEQQNLTAARELFKELYPLMRGSSLETNPIPIKAAMELAGMAAGPCRLPMTQISATNREKLTVIVRDLNLELANA